MKKPNKESILIAGYISGFLDGYVLSQKTDSMNTLKSYRDAIVLYLFFLENEKKIHSDSLNADCFRHTVIEEWLVWLRESRGCSPESCNNRLASLRTFLKYLGSRDVAYLHLYLEAAQIPRRKCQKKKVEGLTVGLEVAEILYCTIQGEIGEHSSLVLGAYLKGGEEAIYGFPAYCPIEIEHDNGKEVEILFSGILSDICLEKYSGMDIVRLEGKSYSWLMDLTKRSRSFQDAQMSHQAMAEAVMKDYPGSRLVFAGPETSIGRLIVQYEETDWAFLKRTMSSIGLTATPYDRQGGINLYIGIPQLPEKGLSYRLLAMVKDMDLYYHLKANDRPVFAADLTRYQVRSHQLLQLFETIRMGGQVLTLSAYRLDFSNQEMEGDYWLQKAEGLSVAEQYPMHLIGVALMGKVVRAAGDKVLVALEIDRDQEREPVHWFPYSTISASPDGSGWYCMPEIGDDIRIYFPSKDEEEAIALSAASAYTPSGGPDRMQDPNSRYLRTRPGQELALTPKHLKLSCGDGLSSITMLTDGVILISAQKEIEVIGKEGVTLHAEQELGLHSQGLMEIESSSGGKIELNEQTATVSGTEVKFDQ